ncbi:MAG: DUF4382 domain-containing protein [Bacteroidetes bacterium]|nr:MAG: DUF4382 domain-containing protein [Bacteroidota bacterium]
MTDAPGPYDEVNVEIVGVEIHSDVNGWNTLAMSAPGVYNLLDFTNGLDTLIASSTLPSGNISQLRLILGDNNTVVIGGTSYPLKTPSAQQSGLKLQIHQNLIPDITYTILLDFDASQSIVETGNGKYILKPVLRTITEGIDGIIQGNLDPDMVAQIWAIHNGDTFGTYSDSSGAFMIKGLEAGTYQVDILPPSPYADTTFNGVGVVNGQITNMGTLNIQ